MPIFTVPVPSAAAVVAAAVVEVPEELLPQPAKEAATRARAMVKASTFFMFLFSFTYKTTKKRLRCAAASSYER